MRINAYMAEIGKLHKRTETLLVDEDVLTADVKLPTETITIFLGEGEIKYLLNGIDMQAQGIRNRYTASEKAWEIALGDLRTKVELAENLNPKLVRVAVAPYMKDVVLDRITGIEDDIPDPEVILNIVAVKREKLLEGMLLEHALPGNFRLELPLNSPSKVYKLSVTVSGHLAWIFYGGTNDRSSASVKENLSFLNNFDAIKVQVEKAAKVVKAAMDLSSK